MYTSLLRAVEICVVRSNTTQGTSTRAKTCTYNTKVVSQGQQVVIFVWCINIVVLDEYYKWILTPKYVVFMLRAFRVVMVVRWLAHSTHIILHLFYLLLSFVLECFPKKMNEIECSLVEALEYCSSRFSMLKWVMFS